MRVAFGMKLADVAMNLEAHAQAHSLDIAVTTIDVTGSVKDFAGIISRFRPDVIAVMHQSIAIVPILRQLCVVADVPQPRIIVCAAEPSNLMKVQAFHHGVFDLIDTSHGAAHVAEQLSDIATGVSTLNTDRLWNVVNKPHVISDLSNIPEDDFDTVILELVRIGLSDTDIGKVIFLSTQTVRNRVSAMLHRAQLDNRTQLGWFYTSQVMTKEVVRPEAVSLITSS